MRGTVLCLCQIHIETGVHIDAIIGNAKVQMVACGDACAAGQADLLACADDGPAADAETAQVHVNGFETILVVNGDIVSGRGV